MKKPKRYLRGKEKKRGPGWVGFSGAEHPTSRPVVQLSKAGHLLETWPSLINASLALHIHYTSIYQCCRGIGRKSAGGYIWKYLDEYDETKSQ